MFELMIAAFFYAFYISVFLWISLIIYRVWFVYKEKYGIKDALKIIMIPLSFGYYQIVTKEKQSRWYNFMVILTFIFGVIASLLPIYMHLRLNII